MDALIRYHLCMEPDDMDDEKYARVWSGLNWILNSIKKRPHVFDTEK
jgi:hypothetical protein